MTFTVTEADRPSWVAFWFREAAASTRLSVWVGLLGLDMMSAPLVAHQDNAKVGAVSPQG